MIKIVTDTAVSLPPDVVKGYDITLLGGYLQFGQERFVDHFELTGEQFYEKLAASREIPQYIDPNPDGFKVIYRSLLTREPGADILSIHCTSQLSITVEAARVAAASFPDSQVRIFDTLSVGGGQGLMVREAASMAAQGASPDEVMRRLEDMRSEVKLFLTLDSLDFLARSGRVSQVGKLVGSVLDYKPVLTLQEGRIELHDQYRTRGRALEALRDKVLQVGGGQRHLQVSVMHANCAQDAQEMAKELNFMLRPEVMLTGELGASMGVITGPGALGVSWYVPSGQDVS